MVGGAVAAVLLLGVSIIQWQLWSLDSELDKLRTNRAKQEKLAKDSDKPIKDAAALEEYSAGDVTWLDEVAMLSTKLPPPESVVVSELTAQVLPKGRGGFIKFTGHADTSDRVTKLEDALRDKQNTHTVSGKGTSQDPGRETLQWAFDETVTITPQVEKTAPAASAAQAAPTTKTATPPAKNPPSAKTPQADSAKKGGGQ